MTKIYLTKRNNGIYYYGIVENSKRLWKTTKCSKKADALLFLKTLDSNKPASISTSHTLQSLIQLYKEFRSIRPMTQRSYLYAVDVFTSVLGERPISEYSSDDIERFKRLSIERGQKPTSVNIVFRSVKALLNFAVQRRLINESPFRLVKPVKMLHKKPVYLSKSDVELLLSKMNDSTIKDITEAGLYTGMRLGELVNLQWSSVDLDNNVITVANTDDFTTKSGRERNIPIHDKLKDILKRRYSKNRKYVFTKDGDFRYTLSYVSHKFKKSVIKAGLSPDFHFHSLRHSFASNLVSNGVDIYSVSKLLGHSSINVTQIYSHVAPSALTASVSKLSF